MTGCKTKPCHNKKEILSEKNHQQRIDNHGGIEKIFDFHLPFLAIMRMPMLHMSKSMLKLKILQYFESYACAEKLKILKVF